MQRKQNPAAVVTLVCIHIPQGKLPAIYTIHNSQHIQTSLQQLKVLLEETWAFQQKSQKQINMYFLSGKKLQQGDL